MMCPYDGHIMHNFTIEKGNVRRHYDLFVALYVLEQQQNQLLNNNGRPKSTMSLRDVQLPTFNNETSLIFEDKTYGGVFEKSQIEEEKGSSKNKTKGITTPSKKENEAMSFPQL